jgi:spore maturation protein CgeB
VRVVMFYHSLVSDWNHGNAHFLRGVVHELLDRGHDVHVYEPRDGWSRANLLQEHGPAAIERFHRACPRLRSETYEAAAVDLDAALHGAELVIVHEWNDHALVARIGEHRARRGAYRLLFHDTHHRSVSDVASMSAYDLRHYDGVLAFGDTIRDLYLSRGWTARAWTWHEAADTRIFFPRTAANAEESAVLASEARRAVPSAASAGSAAPARDLVWIGNWGDEERTAEIDEFLLQPVKTLGLSATVYGVRYPDAATRRLAACGIEYRGWLANTDVPAVFARHTLTVHIPRRPYLELLPGVPTIRPFEALACGIPLVCARWDRTAGLFTPGEDFLVARDGAEMTALLASLLGDPAARARLSRRGLATIAARHTCAHRVDELLEIYTQLAMEAAA